LTVVTIVIVGLSLLVVEGAGYIVMAGKLLHRYFFFQLSP
jgi:hypothetical protein